MISSDGASRQIATGTVWLIQTNPKNYDIDSALRVLGEIDCIVSDFAQGFHEGDQVYLWRGGTDSAMVACATICSEPSKRKSKQADLLFYKKLADTEDVLNRVSIRIDRVLDRPVPREAFLNDPVMKDSQMVLQENGGHFPLTQREYQAIEALLYRDAFLYEKQLLEEATKIKETPHVSTVQEDLIKLEMTKSGDYSQPPLDEIIRRVKHAGLKLDERLIRRYHLALHSRGFVILAGLSGTGKTWLSKAYADAVQATYELVCVAPNWNSNEHLLGHVSPFKKSEYIDTSFSSFLRRASDAYTNATSVGLTPKPFHVVLDEMNLARVEYYFALFLSKMEERARTGLARLRLGQDEVLLPPNLFFIGTVNIDETTHGFSDKVYDRAQLIELEATEDLIEEHIGNKPYKEPLMTIWRILHLVAPFTFRVLDDIIAYVDHAEKVSTAWQDAFDEQVTQKILPKIKGKDPATISALRQLAQYCESTLPMTHRKTLSMIAASEKTGVVSYFT